MEDKICGNGGREDKIRKILCYVASDEEPSLLELHGSWYITSLREQSSLTPFKICEICEICVTLNSLVGSKKECPAIEVATDEIAKHFTDIHHQHIDL